jgi:hypothetical protein
MSAAICAFREIPDVALGAHPGYACYERNIRDLSKIPWFEVAVEWLAGPKPLLPCLACSQSIVEEMQNRNRATVRPAKVKSNF